MSLAFHGFGQCTVDVVIQEGTSIEMCASDPVSISASSGYVSYAWTGPESLAGQTITPQFTGEYVVAAEDGIGCISTDTIDVIIHANPTPTILSSEGNPICASSPGTTLSVDNTYASYDWGAGNSGPTFFAPGVGAYAVTVTDNNGCTGHTVISITTYNFQLTSTSIGGCYGTTVLLQASGGNTYSWSTGETGSSIVVAPAATTTYTVTVTVTNGSCTEDLSIDVDAVPEYSFDLVDTLYMAVDETETLYGPTGSFTYNWFPDDQIDNPNSAVVTLTAASSHTLYLEATHSTGCVIEDSVVVIVVDLSIPDGFSPNGDGINDMFVVPQLYELDGSFTVWNRWGDMVFESDHYENNWDGTCETSLCLGKGVLPEGTYFYSMVVQDVKYTGYITLKL